jgi:hypothetical protein
MDLTDGSPFIELVVWRAQDTELKLVIPISDIQRLAMVPRKWLRYVAWAITGLEGRLSRWPAGPPIPDNELASHKHVIDGEVYFYLVEPGISISIPLDLTLLM